MRLPPPLAGLCGALAFFSCLLVSSGTHALSEAAVRDWSEDLDFYHNELAKRHINLYHKISREEFAAELDALRLALPGLNEHQVQARLMAISRLVGDGHTQLAFWGKELHYFPLGLTLVDGAIRVTRSRDADSHLLGAKLHSIDGTPVSNLIEKLSPLVQGVENQYSLKAKIGWHLGQAETLHGLGITGDPLSARYRFETDAGQMLEHRLKASSTDSAHGSLTRRLTEIATPFGDKKLQESDALWLSHDAAHETAYLYFAAYPSFSDMESFARKLRGYLDKHKVRNLVLDLRNNTGGDFFVGLRLAHQLVLVDGLDWDRGIYTLIGNRTFSAGMSNAAHFRQMLNARLVGEPTGGNPFGYQDMDQFTLPNSRFVVTYSKRNYRFQDDFSSGLIPDVAIKTEWEAFKRGQDPALQWVMQDIASRQ
jgi:hypothetical protein